VFFRLGAAGRQPARGARRLAAGRAEGDLDLEANETPAVRQGFHRR
jgi:hypothetical protein